jgi:hypothetical protein
VSETVAAALIAAAASALGSILAFVVGIRRSLKTSNGAPLAKLLEARLGHVENGGPGAAGLRARKDGLTPSDAPSSAVSGSDSGRSTDDGTEGARGRVGSPDSGDDSASRYHRGRGRPPDPVPELVFEIEIVSGEEGRRLRMAQAEAIRDLLVWIREEYLAGNASRQGGTARTKGAQP